MNTEFFTFYKNPLQPSAWIDYPKRYKFTGVEILADFNHEVCSRQTADLLMWMGNLGGL